MNCNTNSPKNLRLIDGTLAITVIREKYLNKEYTSARITTKENFTYGRFEIRAALPKGEMLRPAIFMIPEKFDGWAKNGQIDIMTNIQDNKLGAGIHYSIPAKYEYNTSGDFSTLSNLNDFHTYSIEWNESEIKWFFDDINRLTININRSLSSLYSGVGQPFDKPFRLLINLGVGGGDGNNVFFPSRILSLEDVINWKCSLLIIDYVRIYKWERIDKWQNGSLILNSSSNDVSVDKICEEVMPLITPKNASNEKTSTTTVMIVSIISSFVLLVLISIVVFLLIRQRNLKRINDEKNIENYDDTCEPETYDAIYTGKEYTEPYQELTEYYVVSEGTEKYEEMADQKKDRNCDP
ncbi:MAG TPA: family 16 glycosylhydrolase, partial [Ignavibacteriaceae bacterium]